jgi:hypothetical protein
MLRTILARLLQEWRRLQLLAAFLACAACARYARDERPVESLRP